MRQAESAPASETGAAQAGIDIDVMRVMELIPHRYPFLMVDRVDAIIPDVSCIGVKNVSINEPFFMGHFPKRPVMPGVLIIESMAQTAGSSEERRVGKECVSTVSSRWSP